MPEFPYTAIVNFVSKSFGFLKPNRAADRLLAYFVTLLFLLALAVHTIWALALFWAATCSFVYIMGGREIKFQREGIDKAARRVQGFDVRLAEKREASKRRMADQQATPLTQNDVLGAEVVDHDLRPRKQLRMNVPRPQSARGPERRSDGRDE